MPRRRATAGSTRTSSTSTNATWPPSTYYYRQIFGCFFRDQHGIDAIDVVGPDNVTFETDYPHTDSTWPHTKQVAEQLMAGVPPDVVDKVMRGNAIRMLSLDL